MDNKFRTMVERSIQGIVIIQDFRVVYSNQAFAKISGFSKKELLSLTPSQMEKVIHPDHRALVWGRMSTRLLGKKAVPRYEFKGIRKDGSVRWLEMVANRIEHEEKHAILGAIIDITERKKAEEALQKSQANLLALIENSQASIWSVDRHFRILTINSQFKEMFAFAYGVDLKVGMKITDCVSPKMKRTWVTRYNRAFRGESFVIEEDFLIYGKTINAEISFNPIRNNGEITGVSVFSREITEQKQAKEALRESEEKYRAIFESFHDVYYRTDRKGLVTIISPSVRTHAGWDPEDIIGHPVTDFYRDPSKRETFREKLKESGVINDYELKLLSKDGRVIDVSVSSKIIFNKDGKPTGVEGVLRDITDRKHAEEQVKSSLKEKEVLLQEIHHRVKNNMQIISSLLNLQSHHIEDDKVKDMFKMSRDRIKSMALIHEKLYQSKDLTKINFAQYIQSLAVHLLNTYNVSMERIKLNAKVTDVFLDINKAIPCGLIINELVSNSLKHAFPQDKKGNIRIQLNRGNNGYVRLVVSDDGIGFSENVDFQHPDSLGLQLVNDLVDQLGGTLELDSSKGISYQISFST